MTILQLGRFGDVINILPMLYGLNKQGTRPTLVVSDEFSGVVDGMGYFDIKRFNRGPIALREAINLASHLPNLRIAQPFQHPDQSHQTDSFAKESYRLTGFPNLWRIYPTVFDNRSPEREQALFRMVFPHVGMVQPFIAVALTGVSSPFPHAKQLMDAIQHRFSDHLVVDLCSLKAEKIHDLLGIMDEASCLVTIDTAHLWLSNATKSPTVALVNNSGDPWFASPPSTTTVASFGYKQFQADQVCDAIESATLPPGDIVMVADVFGSSPRHKKAQKSWLKTKAVTRKSWGKDATSIGDARPLPSLKAMLSASLEFTKGRDIVVWTNDDVQVVDIKPAALHVARFGAVTIRRDPSHIGREMAVFRWDWLADRLRSMPEMFIAAPWFDLALAAWIRKQFSIESTMENLSDDWHPCEIPNDGIFIHEDHESHWVGEKESWPAAKWNERIFAMLVKR